MRISKRTCDELAAGLKMRPGNSRITHWGEVLPGLGVSENSNGTLSYILRFRVKGDPRQRVVTLGSYPSLNPDTARTSAQRIRASAHLGENLVANQAATRAREASERKDAVRRAVLLSNLLDQWRTKLEYRHADKVKRGESAEYERMLLRLEAKVLRPELGDEHVGSIDPNRFQAIIHRQASRSVANNLRAAIVQFVRHANAEMTGRGFPLQWPTRFEVLGKVRFRDHRFTLDEAARICIAAGALGRRGAMVRFMLLTGCRRIEAQKVEWTHIVFDEPLLGPYWQQPAHLTKNHLPHRVPLSEPVVALLKWLPVRTTVTSGASQLIFAGRGGKPVGSWTAIMRHLRSVAEIKQGNLHDFRRTIVSSLGDAGFDPQVADSLLNHAATSSMSGIMRVYQRSDLWAKQREAIDVWTAALMGAVEQHLGRPPSTAWALERKFKEVRLPSTGEIPKRNRRKLKTTVGKVEGR